MSPGEFRRWGRRVVDWVADYMEGVGDYPVRSRVEPGDLRSRLPDHPPAEGEAFGEIVEDLDRLILPGVTHWQSPDFYAYFPANASGPSILGELVSAGLGVQGMLWATSPACTELETHVLDWLVEMLDLPSSFRSRASGGGVIQDTASSASLCALLAARERATGGESNRRGVGQVDDGAAAGDGALTAYASSQAHSSIEKAIRIAGIGSDNLRLVDVDDDYALDPGTLAEAIRSDRAAGRRPFFVAATVGTTSSTAIDPVEAIGRVCRDAGAWLHVDAAHAGTAALCPEFRWIHEGLELADSYCFNPHKWMLTNFDCDCFFVADRRALIGALSILPEYLRDRSSEREEVFDYRDWQIPLGRRFRALKLWFVIRHYGVEGLRAHVRHHVAMARRFAGWIEASDRFELVAPTPLNLVCFRRVGDDASNRRLMEALNRSGELYLTHTKLDGRFVLRLAIGGTRTEEEHVEAAWERIVETERSIGG